MQNVLLLGQSGQLACELRATAPASIKLKVMSYSEFYSLSDAELLMIFRNYRPDWVINAVAYNQVDQAEIEPEQAMAGNFYLVQRLQQLCASSQSRLLHISTDYVFDGLNTVPCKEQDPALPVNQYGKSKLSGELWLLQEYAEFSVIIRTSWLYSIYGSNFVKTMLALMRNKTQLKVVRDQVGSPCWAYGLACTIWLLIVQKKIVCGLYHWADSGFCSRYELALEIQAIALDLGLLKHKVEIEALGSKLFNNSAVRPAFSALDSSLLRERLSLPAEPWQQQLAQALKLFSPVAPQDKKDL